MAENPRSSATPWLAFLVGGLIVAVAVIGYFMYAGGSPATPKLPASVDVNVDVPKAPSIPDAPRLPDAPIPTPK